MAGSVARHAKQLRLEHARQREGACQSQGNAHQRQADALFHHQREHRAPGGAKGHAHADLLRPARDVERHHAVDADGRQQQRKTRRRRRADTSDSFRWPSASSIIASIVLTCAMG